MIRASLFGTLALCLVVWDGAAADDPPPSEVAMGRPAPPYSVRTADGFVRRAEEFEGPSGLLLVFATHDTMKQIRTLERRLQMLADRGLNTLIVDIDCFASPQASEILWAESGIALPVRYDDGEVAGLFEVDGVPFAALIDGEGIVRYLGGTGASGSEWRNLMDFFEDYISGVPNDPPALPAGNPDLSFLPRCHGVGR